MPDPMRRTTDTPTYPASRSRRNCRGGSTRGCGPDSRCGRRRRKRRIAPQPVAHHVVVKLLRPQQARERLPHHGAAILGQVARRQPWRRIRRPRGCGLRRSASKPAPNGSAILVIRQPQFDHRLPAGRQRQRVVRRRLGAAQFADSRPRAARSPRTRRCRPSRTADVRRAPKRRQLRLVLREQQLCRVRRSRASAVRNTARRARSARPPPAAAPASEPCSPHAHVLRNQIVGSRCSAAASGPRFACRDADQHIVRRRLGVLHEDVEVAVLREDARVEQFVLRVRRACAGDSPPPACRKGIRLRILVQALHVRVAWACCRGRSSAP